MKSLLVLLCLFLVFSALADDHSLSTIKGTAIDLKVYDHAIAGSVKDFVIFGNKDEETFSSELIMKKHGQVIRATFGKLANGIGGTISHLDNGVLVSTEVRVEKIDTDLQQITMTADGKNYVVQIEGEDFQNGHFMNPSYRTVVDGKTVEFKVEAGEACYGFSVHLIMMILGAYLHN
ncbi:MAG: hypothetical protein HYV97_18190 [Bdellovibrio sp.]|nr:hypothetical protein [Bdellovibrio sp.]